MTASTPDWAALYLTYRQVMWRVAVRILRPAGHMDLVDDAVMQAMQSLLSAHPPPDVRNPEALLVTVTRRRAFDLLRKPDVRFHATQELHMEDVPDVDADIADDAEHRLDRERLGRQAVAELANLPALQQAVIRKVIMEEQEAKQVAIEIGLSPARISQVRKAALMALRQRLKHRPTA
ncbi:MAG: sigma-70 family RNA polymerase sigma factor [Propionibacteriaceae bacterium]|jgi:RNA polymerase sigma-70 factor (ECF subfamily)|nr:sigma-70 family RNA polymerase sigma factor [Propionibacteriaceae bacterium]